MSSYARHKKSVALADLNFSPRVFKYGMLEWSKFDQILEAGYAHAMERKLEQLSDEEINGVDPDRTNGVRMIKRIIKSVEIIGILFLVLLVILFLPSVFNPGFVVKNTTSDAISVTACARRIQEIGEIEANDLFRFHVNDEAAMTFRVTYA